MNTRVREFDETHYRQDIVNKQTRFSSLKQTSLLKFEWFAGSQVCSTACPRRLFISWSHNTGQMLCLAPCNHEPRSKNQGLNRERVRDRPWFIPETCGRAHECGIMRRFRTRGQI